MAYSNSFTQSFNIGSSWESPQANSIASLGVSIEIGDSTSPYNYPITIRLNSGYIEQPNGEYWGKTSQLYDQCLFFIGNSIERGPYSDWDGETFSFSERITNKNSKIRCRLIDTQLSTSYTYTFDIVDLSVALNEPPTISIDALPSNLFEGATYPITVYVSDPEGDQCTGELQAVLSLGTANRYVDISQNIGKGTNVINYKIPAGYIGGRIRFIARATDSAGNEAAVTSGWSNIIQNSSPSAVFNITGVNPGGSASIKWTYSDPDGHSVKTKSLVRYYQAKNSTTWQTTALTVSADSTSATDAIPLSYNGGTVYYVLKFEDEYGAAGELKSSNYTLQTVTPPTMPPSITYPNTINGGETITISWGASTDQENNLAGYEVEGTYNGSTWFQVYKAAQPNTRTTTALVEYGQNTITYRVRAYDTTNLYSDWKIGNTVTIVNNQAPTIPASITVPATVVAGQAVVIKWGASTDPDGDAVSYELQRQVNGGSFTVVGTTAGLNYTDTIGSDWTTVVYRVRAKDAKGAYSGFRTAPSRTVTQNRTPTIQCEYQNDQDLGIKSETFSFTYSVNDEDASDTLTVREYLDGAQIKSFVATRNQTYTFDFANNTKWKSLVNGEHTIRISVTDGKATKNLNLTFIKATSGCTITLANPISVAETIKYAVLSVSFTLPYENLWTSAGVFNLEVFNRGFHRIDAKAIEGASASDAWEECLIDPSETYENKGNIFKQGNNILIAMKEGHVMMIHKFATTGNKFNYRLIADSDDVDDLGHICSIQGAIGVNDITFPDNLNG